MPVLNGGFEEAGAAPGEAAHWRLRTRVRAESVAGFGPESLRAHEDFERWSAPLERVLTRVTVAVFEPRRETTESFAGGWDNDAYLRELPTGAMEAAPFESGTADDMGLGWGVEGYVRAWSEMLATLASFDGSPAEDFERRWRENERYARDWNEVADASALFDGTDTERFDGVWESVSSL